MNAANAAANAATTSPPAASRLPSLAYHRPAIAFLRFELRRHLPLLVTGWAVLLLVPLGSWLVEGRWRYVASGWNEAAALFACLIVAPLMAVAGALNGFAAERRGRTLEWLYARPIPATTLFLLRLAAGAISVLAFCGVALAANRVAPSQLASGLELVGIELGSTSLLLLVPSLLGFALALGTFASATAESSNQAAGRTVITAAVLVLLALTLWWSGPALVIRWQLVQGALSRLVFLALAFLILSLLAASWWALRHSPSDGRRRARSLAVLLPCIVVLAAAGLGVLLQPLRADLSRIERVVALAGGAELRLAASPVGGERTVNGPGRVEERRWALSHPLLELGDERRIFRRFFTEPAQVWPSPTRDRVLIFGAGADGLSWLLLGADGSERFVDPGAVYRFRPLGWSRGGSHFAWRSGPGRHQLLLVVLGDAGTPRTVAARLPRADLDWGATWIDDQRLLVTPSPPLPELFALAEGVPALERTERPGWWLLASSEGEVLGEPRRLGPGEFLLLPGVTPDPRARPIGTCGGTIHLTRHGAHLYAWRGDAERLTLVALDLEGGGVTPVAGRDWPLAWGAAEPTVDPSSLAVTDDGRILWAELPSPADRWRVPARLMSFDPLSGAEPRPACTVERWPRGRGMEARFRGVSGGWALWRADADGALLACHLPSGRTRRFEAAELGPGGDCSVDVLPGGVLLTPRGELRLDG